MIASHHAFYGDEKEDTAVLTFAVRPASLLSLMRCSRRRVCNVVWVSLLPHLCNGAAERRSMLAPFLRAGREQGRLKGWG